LPDKLVCSVCEFLPKTSCALLAVALTAPLSSWKKYQREIIPNTKSKAIISSIKHSTPYKSLLEEIMKERLELVKLVGHLKNSAGGRQKSFFFDDDEIEQNQ